MQILPKRDILAFFLQKHIISDPKQLDSLLRSFYPASSSFSQMKKSHFLRILSSALMRGLLLRLYRWLQQTQEQPLGLKVMRLQRLILLQGIKAKSNLGITAKDGKVQREGLSEVCAGIVNGL